MSLTNFYLSHGTIYGSHFVLKVPLNTNQPDKNRWNPL